MATAPSANDLTRQQLDELDELLQRMLALPITSADAGSASPASASLGQAPSMRLTAPPLPTIEPPRPVFSPPAPMPAPEPTTPIIDRKVVAPSVQIRTMPIPAAHPAPAPATSPATPAEPPREPVFFLLWPLVALNWLFDATIGLFGPPGWLIRSGFGKNVLGLAGIALLLYTAAHVCTQQGWFTLPFPVPWPK